LPEERLVFARHLEAPPFDPAQAPKLPSDTWPKARLEKAYRNYAIEYVRSSLPLVIQLFGPHDGAHLLHLTGRLIGMQSYTDIAASFPASDDSPAGFGALLTDILRAQGDDAEFRTTGDHVTVSHRQWNAVAGVSDYHPACLEALRGLIEGLMDAHGRRLRLTLNAESDAAPGPLTWTIASRPLAPSADSRFPA
jgi:hypothetical protein